jgi:hypothetical protein
MSVFEIEFVAWHIFRFLPWRNVIACSFVSKQFRNISLHDQVWREMLDSEFGDSIALRRCGKPPTAYLKLFRALMLERAVVRRAAVLRDSRLAQQIADSVACASSYDR